MRRTLTLIRHAKSDYPDGVADHDRPLTERGERDAAAIAEHLRGDAWPDLVLCSTARRARSTWDLAEAGLDRPTTVRYEPSLYAASARSMLGLIRATGDDVHGLVVVGHNPGTQELAVALAGRGDAALRRKLEAKLPTSGLAVLAVDGSWADLEENAAELVALHVPRG